MRKRNNSIYSMNSDIKIGLVNRYKNHNILKMKIMNV